MIRPSTGAGRRVIMDLLEHWGERAVARVVAERTGLSIPSVNDVLRFLRFHGAISATGNRVRWRQLVTLAASLRLPEVVPVRSVQGASELNDITAALADVEVEHIFAFTTAANRWAYFEPDPATHVIVAGRQAKRAADALFQQRVRHGDSHTIHIFEDDLAAIQVERLASLPLTSRLQTWIDLKVFPHAGAHAAFFEQVVDRLYPGARES